MRKHRTIDMSSSMYNMGLGICIFAFFILLSFMMKAPIKEMTKDVTKGEINVPANITYLISENEAIRKENKELRAKIVELETK